LKLDRIDLADLRSPLALAKALHRQLGQLVSPVPVIEIAQALDIQQVRIAELDGVEGMLLTDRVRSTGAILVNGRHGHRRARFTIAHELGHFLMEWHTLSGETGFTCSSQDMRVTWQGRRELRQEAEANRFAIEILAPQSMVTGNLSRDPDLRDAQHMRDALDLSLEACVRRMVDCRDEPLAGIWSHNGQVRYLVRNNRFPFVTLKKGNRLPQTTTAFRVVANGRPGFTRFSESPALAWTSRPEWEIFEQTRVGRDGHAVTLLWADLPDDDEDDGGIPELTTPRFR
jgi:Zn-dependent peptidase ImmA (M78 family)